MDNDRWVVGTRFNVDLWINSSDSLNLKLGPVQLPEGLVLVAGPLIRPTVWLNDNQATVSGTRMTLTYRVNKAGLVSLGPYVVSNGKEEVFLPSKDVAFLERDEANRKFPLQSQWILPPGPYYTGQNLPLRLQFRNLDSIPTPQEIALSAPSRAILERLQGSGEIEITSWGGEKMFHIPGGTWMLTPTFAGNLVMPPINYSIDGLSRTTPEVLITIEDPPREIAQSRAIGDFIYDIQLESHTSEVRVRQTLQGRGNFSHLVFPEVSGESLLLLTKEESHDYSLVGDQYQGKRSILWRFLPQKTGTLSIAAPGYKWFNPQRQRVMTHSGKTLKSEVQFLPLPQEVDSRSTMGLLDPSELESYYPILLLSWPWLLLWFIPGIVGVVLGLRQKRINRVSLVLLALFSFGAFGANPPSIPEAWKTPYQAFEEGNFELAAVQFRMLLKDSSQDAALWHNLGVAQFRLGQVSESIFSLRSSLKLQSTSKTLDLLTFVEGQEDLLSPFALSNPLRGDWMVILVVVLGNLVLVAFTFWWINPRPYRWIALILSGVLFVMSTGFLGYQGLANNEPWAVIGPLNASIRRVPGELAENWMTLKAGTSVKVLGRSGKYLQVQSSFGLEGWISEGSYREAVF